MEKQNQKLFHEVAEESVTLSHLFMKCSPLTTFHNLIVIKIPVQKVEIIPTIQFSSALFFRCVYMSEERERMGSNLLFKLSKM